MGLMAVLDLSFLEKAAVFCSELVFVRNKVGLFILPAFR